MKANFFSNNGGVLFRQVFRDSGIAVLEYRNKYFEIGIYSKCIHFALQSTHTSQQI